MMLSRKLARVKRAPLGAQRAQFTVLQSYKQLGLHRRLHTDTNQSVGPSLVPESEESVGIIGGGISGLTTAYYLSQVAPSLPITVFEKSNRLGGWIKSNNFRTEDGPVLFEEGPRTLRPNTVAGLVTLHMVRRLGLLEEVVVVPKDAPSAKNRFIYYPDRITRLGSFMQAPLLDDDVHWDLMRGALRDLKFWRGPFREKDMSIGEFFSRQMSPEVADNAVSAMVHGIYAGDIYKLSVRSLFPTFWHAQKYVASVLIGSLSGHVPLDDIGLEEEITTDPAVKVIKKVMEKASVFTFRGGMETLAKRLVEDLKSRPNITIYTDTDVKSIDNVPGGIEVRCKEGEAPFKFTNVVSSLFARDTNSLFPQEKQIAELGSMEAVNVMVVNVYFPNTKLMEQRGFGYLIPRSVSEDLNPHKVLGVVFDSDTLRDAVPLAGKDPEQIPPPPELATGTTITVMMGGHWWKSPGDIPDPNTAAQQALETVYRHLDLDPAVHQPTYVNAVLQHNCIPQYYVGHRDRMARAHDQILENFQGRLSVTGSSYHGVGLNDCIRYAADVAMGLRGWRVRDNSRGYTGLEKYKRPEEWAIKEDDD